MDCLDYQVPEEWVFGFFRVSREEYEIWDCLDCHVMSIFVTRMEGREDALVYYTVTPGVRIGLFRLSRQE